MQLAIAQNPHVKDPQKLWKVLDQSEPKAQRPVAFDAEGMERFKAAIAGTRGTKMIIK